MPHIADADVAEALVWHLWQTRLPKNRPLRLIDGRQVRVYHAGTLNPDSGPDFLNAELAFGPGRCIRGDVEMHIRPVDWRRHGHGTDPGYNRVILHVVMWHDEEDAAVIKQNGQYVPTLVLSETLTEPFDRLRRRYAQAAVRTAYPCEDRIGRAGAALRTVFVEAGEARFRAKARAMEARMSRVSPEQTLYEGCMAAAGYTKNAEPMCELARRVPVARLRDAVRGLPDSARLPVVRALFFGAAGLLPSQRARPSLPDDPYVRDLEARWAAYSAALPVRPMEETAWRFFRLRPFNFPTVRLAGMSCLVVAGLDQGIDTPFLEAMDTAGGHPPKRRLRAAGAVLDRLLRHDPADYWLVHSTFGGTRHAGRSHLIGPGRRRDMMVNAVLPFLLAHARRAGIRGRRTTLLEMYAVHPKLPGNTVTRTMTALLFRRAPGLRRLIDSARCQQGLLHIYDQTCERKECGQCILNGDQEAGVEAGVRTEL